MTDLGFKLLLTTIVLALWLVSMLSFGSYRAERARCEMYHGSYRLLDRDPVCIAPGTLKLIPVDR